MDADLDLLLIYVFCIADDLLPAKSINHRRSLTDAEVVTLAVAQSIMGIPSDHRFIKTAIKRLGHLFPGLTQRSGFYRRRDRLASTIEALIASFARLSPGWEDNVLRSIPPRWSARARARPSNAPAPPASMTPWRTPPTTATAPATAATSTACGCIRLRPGRHPPGDDPDQPQGQRTRHLPRLLARVNRTGPLTVIGDKGYAGRQFETDAALLNATILRPRRKDEPGHGRHLAPIRQRIESIYWTAKDILTLERHGARTLHGLRARASRAACSRTRPASRSTTNCGRASRCSSPSTT